MFCSWWFSIHWAPPPSSQPPPTLPLGYQPPLVYALLSIEPSSTRRSLSPHCNSSWIKSAFTPLTTARLWCSLMAHRCYLASLSCSNLICKMGRQLSHGAVVGTRLYNGGKDYSLCDRHIPMHSKGGYFYFLLFIFLFFMYYLKHRRTFQIKGCMLWLKSVPEEVTPDSLPKPKF